MTGPRTRLRTQRDRAQGTGVADLPELDALAEAWIALWQSELAGLAADPEVAAAWRQAFGLGAAWLRGAGGVPSHERASGAARETGPARPCAAGPRPLALHLALAAGDPLGGADAARLRARIDELERRLAALERGTAGGGADRRGLAAGGHPPEAFAAAVERAPAGRDADLLRGILAYRRHPFRRALPVRPCVWTEGGSRLLDYGGPPGARGGARRALPDQPRAGAGPAARGLDAAPPGGRRGAAAAARLGRAGAAGARLLPDRLRRRPAGTRPGRGRGAGRRAGGAGRLLHGRAAGARRGAAPAGPAARPGAAGDALGFLGRRTPPAPGAWPPLLPLLEPLLQATGTLPVDALQALFAALDPAGIGEKYRAFARLDPDSPRRAAFVALEDWLNDGVPLAAPVARECLAGWYGANTPARGDWRIAGEVVAPQALRLPAFLAIPARDRIVPPASALALAAAMPGALFTTPRPAMSAWWPGAGRRRSSGVPS